MGLFRKREVDKPDIPKDEAPKPGYIRFWQLYFRNFTKMLGYSALILACGVFLVVATINVDLILGFVGTIEGIEGIEEAIPSSWVYLIGTIALSIPWYVTYPLVLIAIILQGPLMCGLTYCMRNHTREEHVWGSDVFVRAWRNKWQGLILGIIDAMILFGVVMYAFGTESLGMDGNIFVYFKFLSYGIGLIWFIMRWYAYQMVVTFNLKIRGILKNAWMFVILGIWRNLAMVVIIALITALFLLFPMYYPATMPFFLICMMMIFWSLTLFFGVFVTYPVTHRYLVAPAMEEQKRIESLKRASELRARKEAGEEIDEEELAELEEYLEKDKKKRARRKAAKKKSERVTEDESDSAEESESGDEASEDDEEETSENV